jgi:hypothetical protein
LALTREDILDVARDSSNYNMYVYEFIRYDRLYVFDRSQDINGNCLFECTKLEIKSPPKVLIITMIRAQDELSAIQTAEELYAELEPYPDEWDAEKYCRRNIPPDHCHVGFSGWNYSFVIVTSAGPIAIRIESLGESGDDAGWELATPASFLSLQIEKLKEANVVP